MCYMYYFINRLFVNIEQFGYQVQLCNRLDKYKTPIVSNSASFSYLIVN